jgi:hypothetical protein
MAAPGRAPEVRRNGAQVRDLRTPVVWGVVFGCLQAVSPLAFPWLDSATVYALELAFIAAVYIGFSVADGRGTVIAVETGMAAAFVVVAAVAVTGSAWLIVAGLLGHGTRWWPPFCATVDVVAAAVIAAAIVAGSQFGW